MGYGREPQTQAQRDAALAHLSGLSRPETFYEGRISRNYLLAGQEVRQWLDIVGQEGLLDFLERIRSGMDFEEAYRLTERAYQK